MLMLIILVLSLFGSYFLPWWSVAVIAFLAALFVGKTPWGSFLAGFGAIFTLWAGLALFKSVPNEHLLASRVVQLFPIPHHWILLLLITALIGGVVGGMAALSGCLLKRVILN